MTGQAIGLSLSLSRQKNNERVLLLFRRRTTADSGDFLRSQVAIVTTLSISEPLYAGPQTRKSNGVEPSPCTSTDSV